MYFYLCFELIYGNRIVFSAILPTKYIGREILMMNGIREILGLQCKTAAVAVGHPIFSGLYINKIACIKLYSWQGGVCLQNPAALRAFYCSNMPQRTVPVINDKVMIITAGQE